MQWRPRHSPCLDIAKEEEEITTNFKKYSALLEDEDLEFLSKIDKEKREKFKKQKESLMTIVKRRRDMWEAVKDKRESLYIPVEERMIEVEFVREEILKNEEEILKSD